MYPVVKRLIDITGAGVGLIVAAPLYLILALLIRSHMGAPVLFRQQRPGRHGKPFTLLKFRTMTEGDGPDGDRLTGMGRFLRATSLDELPELWNILKGDMSFIGPRPLLMEYLPHFSTDEMRRHEVRPGLSGLAQVKGRNILSWDERLALDVTYVERMSFGLDLQILMKTVAIVLSGKGVSAPGHATMKRLDEERGG